MYNKGKASQVVKREIHMIFSFKSFFTKIKYLLLLSPLVLVLSSCSNKYLSTPKNLKITDDCYLVWDKVNNATGYEVLVSNAELGNSLYTVNDNKFDVLSILSNTEEFKFKVCAKDSTNKYQESNDSKELSFKAKSQLEYFDFTFNEAGYYSMSMKHYEIKTPDNPFGGVTYSYADKIEGVFVIPSTYNGFPVRKLGKTCFYTCNNVTNVYMPDSIDILGELNIFSSNKNLKRIRMSQNLTELPLQMFSNCSSLSELIIPESVAKIGKKVFYNCDNLERIKIGKNVTTILENNFSSCDNLKEIIIDDNNQNYYYKDGCLIDKNDNSIIGVAPLGFKKIPNYVLKIGKYAFSECKTISEIIVPSNIIDIEENAFENCSNVRRIELGTNVTTINAGVFMGLTSLEEFTIPSCVTSIGAGSFSKCNSIKEVVIPSTLKNIGEGMFGECSNLKKATVEEGIEEFDNWFNYCENLEEINLPSTINNIKEYSFRGMKNLKTINIPEENEYFKIDQNCLIDVNNKKILLALKNPSIPDYIETIGAESFANSNVVSIHIPSSVRTIENYAFVGQKKLVHLTFDEGVETIKAGAFAVCNNIETVILPKSLKTIEKNAFYNCQTTFLLYNTIETIGEDAFFLDTVYTNISCLDFPTNLNTYEISWFVIFDCDIDEGYVRKIHNYRFNEIIDGNIHRSHLTWQGLYFIIPHRDGYNFLGFSYDEEMKNLDIPAEHIKEKIRYGLTPIEVTEVEWEISLSLDAFKTIENDIILYSVWEKIE